jgi:hypothetical protein
MFPIYQTMEYLDSSDRSSNGGPFLRIRFWEEIKQTGRTWSNLLLAQLFRKTLEQPYIWQYCKPRLSQFPVSNTLQASLRI